MSKIALVVLCLAVIPTVSCFGGSEDGLPELAATVDSLRQEVERMRSDIATLARRADNGDDGTFTLQLLHASDMDGTTGALQNVENFSAILSAFRNQYPDNTLVLSSGDNWIPGPRYFAAADAVNNPVLGIPGNGRGDIALLNAQGFQASALGNHELDRGTAEFASIVGAEAGEGRTYTGSSFPYLASNLGFVDDENLAPLVVPDGQETLLIGGSLARTAVITVNGDRIGIVGATTPSLASISSSGNITVLPSDYSVSRLAVVIQESVDALTAQGLDKVILLAHMQRIDVEQDLAVKLTGVDVIVAGGSNTLLADDTDRLRPGDIAKGIYPMTLQSASGEPVLLVNTDGDYRYLGRLVMEFDTRGLILPESVDPYVSGAYATDLQGAQLFAGKPMEEVSLITNSLRGVLQERDGNIAGLTGVYLEGRRAQVRTQETNLGNLTADANLWMARQVDPETKVSFKNAGGIREQIGTVIQPPGTTSPDDAQFLPPAANPVAGKAEGEVSQLDIEGSLRFNNGLVIIPLTASQLVEIVEHSIAYEGVGEVPVGAFPQVGGMRFGFDPDAPSGQRVRSLTVIDDTGVVSDKVVENGELQGNPDREIKAVTLNYLANRGDDFGFAVPHPGRIDLAGEDGQPNPPNAEFPDTNGNGQIDDPKAVNADVASFAPSGTEQDALAEYLAHFHSIKLYALPDTGPLEDQRIQNLGVPSKSDTVFMPGSVHLP